MIWLYLAVWVTGHDPKDYKLINKLGPFETVKECWSLGAVTASSIQSKDEASNVLGACQKDEPKFLDMKSMWGMICASLEKDDMCWYKNGKFVDPLK